MTGSLLGTLIATAAALAAVGGLLWQLLSLLAGAIAAGASWVGQQALTQIITDPVHTYLAAHAGQLGVPTWLLWWCWAATALVLLALSWLGSFGARMGWLIIGASTAAMVHAATPITTVNLATGITACAFGVLSVPAFAGAGHKRHVEIHTHYLPSDREHL